TSKAAALPGGGYVVSWTSENQDGDSTGVFARVFDASGAPQTGDIQVNTHVAGLQLSPRVITLADGGFVITWNSIGQDGSGAGVFGQRFSAAGQPLGDEFRLHEFTSSDQVQQSLHATAEGFVAV